MFSIIIFATLASLAFAAPTPPVVEVTQDTEGNYKFTYHTEDSTRVEVRTADGQVFGSIKYYDPKGERKTLEYTSGPQGYQATGPLVPTPVEDLPEVASARNQHLEVFRAVDSLLPRLNEDGLVDEVPEVPLSKEEFIAAVSAVLHGGHLAFAADTPEVSQELLLQKALAIRQNNNEIQETDSAPPIPPRGSIIFAPVIVPPKPQGKSGQPSLTDDDIIKQNPFLTTPEIAERFDSAQQTILNHIGKVELG
ncbi:hypothetical protein Trydic_g14587 [Trypoxylus dichotomus]